MCVLSHQLDRRTPSDVGLLWAIFENTESSFHVSGASSCVSRGMLAPVFIFVFVLLFFPRGMCVCAVVFCSGRMD